MEEVEGAGEQADNKGFPRLFTMCLLFFERVESSFLYFIYLLVVITFPQDKKADDNVFPCVCVFVCL